MEERGSKVRLIDQDRVFNFSDGVFAFAATLLVVKIDLPTLIRNDFDHNLATAFNLLWPQYFINIVSFIVIGYYWMNHHAILGHVKHFTTILVWTNILFLISIAFLPFPVDLYGDFPSSRVAVLFYTSSLAAAGFLLCLVWWYALKSDKVLAQSLSKKEKNYYTIRNLIAPVIFTLSLPLVNIDPFLAPASWVLVVVGLVFLNKKFRIREETL